ncbi:MAG: IclR family transcriptional regulator C-terminal domain-containing protein [Pseudomonas sp.]
MNRANPSSGELQDVSAEADVPRDFVGSVAHGLAVLRSFDRDHRQMTLSEVSARTGMTRAGARRYLLTLAHLGYVEQNERLFRLTPKVLELGYAFMATLPLAELAQPYLDSMTKAMGETTAIAVLENDSIVHLARAMPQRQLAPIVTIGRHFSALFNSTGRMLIACQDDAAIDAWLAKCKAERLTQWTITDKKKLRAEIALARKNQYAIVNQESEEGVCSLAVPVKNRRGEAVAAVNVITNVATVSRKELLEKFLPMLREGADQLAVAISAQV